MRAASLNSWGVWFRLNKKAWGRCAVNWARANRLEHGRGEDKLLGVEGLPRGAQTRLRDLNRDLRCGPSHAGVSRPSANAGGGGAACSSPNDLCPYPRLQVLWMARNRHVRGYQRGGRKYLRECRRAHRV